MGLDWILTPRPRSGCEAEYARLKRYVDEELGGGSGLASNFFSEEERRAVARLHEISVHSGETERAFLADLWEEARVDLTPSLDVPMTAEERRAISLPFDALGDYLTRRFEFASQREDWILDVLGDPRRRPAARYSTRVLHVLVNGYDDGFVWRHAYALLAPGLWGEIDEDSTAERCIESGRRLLEGACEGARRIAPALRGLSEDEVVATVDRWAEQRWMARNGLVETGGREPAPRLPELEEAGSHAFETARWLTFWGARGHGFLRSA
jgi:hypothetical protein